jgi:hypothetical protein
MDKTHGLIPEGVKSHNKNSHKISAHKIIYYENSPLNLNLSTMNKSGITLAFD